MSLGHPGFRGAEESHRSSYYLSVPVVSLDGRGQKHPRNPGTPHPRYISRVVCLFPAICQELAKVTELPRDVRAPFYLTKSVTPGTTALLTSKFLMPANTQFGEHSHRSKLIDPRSGGQILGSGTSGKRWDGRARSGQHPHRSEIRKNSSK